MTAIRQSPQHAFPLDTLHCFVNHWPSKLGGEKRSQYKRVAAMERLKGKYAEYLKIALIGEHPAAKFYAAHGFMTEEKASPMYFFPNQKDR